MIFRNLKLPRSLKNWVSIWGAAMASTSLIIIIFLFLISIIYDAGSSYLGIFIYIIVPIFLVIGLLMIPVGMMLNRKKTKPTEEETLSWPKIDFNKPEVRNASIIFIAGSVVFLILSAIGSFEAFHYTESVEFCGKLCHKVMKPEYVAYHQSSHERVKCVECHVGTGASWYVKSKISGLYQVYSVTFNKYPRPIPTPISNLRPARETCEECHWPQKFYDRKMKMKRNYLADEENSEWDITLMMKTSATYSALGQQEGIHWHINPDVKIEYRADPQNKSTIPWVRYTNRKTGESHIYQDSENMVSSVKLDSLELRVMDCIDCHNRPSHNYGIPQHFVDDAITSGAISGELPNIKSVAMGILAKDYSTADSAMMAIKTGVVEYYKSNYPDILEQKKEKIEKAITGIQDGFNRNIFPEMKVKWNKYPLNLGHLESNGCYRCHNDKHKSDNGRIISRRCDLCHHILSQGKPGQMEYSTTQEALQFKHPVDISDAWKETLCSECHSSLF
jgi:hypothetical protein